MPYDSEEWLPLSGFKDYSISSHGNIRGPRGIRKKHTKNNGYLNIVLWKEGKRISLNIHRLVCEHFNGPPPFTGAQALHRDGIKANVHKDNLYWGTPKQNSQDTKRAGNFPEGENHYLANLTWIQVNDIRTRYLAGERQASIRKRYDLLGPRCSDICLNKTWKDPSYNPALRRELTHA